MIWAARRAAEFPQSMTTIISGERGAGKTTFLLTRQQELSERGEAVCGILSPLTVGPDGCKNGFDAFDVVSGERWPLARTDRDMKGISYGPFSFSSSGFAKANKVLTDGLRKRDCTLFIDEIGPLELKHKEGFYPVLSLLKEQHAPRDIYIVVRPELIGIFTDRYFPDGDCRILEIERTVNPRL